MWSVVLLYFDTVITMLLLSNKYKSAPNITIGGNKGVKVVNKQNLASLFLFLRQSLCFPSQLMVLTY